MLIFVWKGKGYLIPLLPMIWFLFQMLFKFQHSYFILNVVLFSAYASLIFWGFKWNNLPPQKYRNNKTGEEFYINEKHDFFFIQMQYWAIFAVVLISYLTFKSFGMI